MATKAKAIPSIDTNVLLRIILQDDQKLFQKAVAVVWQYETMAIADQAIVEIVYVLGGAYRYSREEIAGVLRQIGANQHLALNRSLLMRTVDHYLKYPTESFVDCYLEASAHLNGHVPLYTFDKKLARDLPDAELLT